MPFHRPIPERKPPFKTGKAVESWIEAEKLMQIAFLLPAAAFVGWIAGVCADRWLHQSWIAIFGVIFGCIAGLFSVIRMALAAERNSPMESKAENGTGEEEPPSKP
jgi:F0F1-type ATP synthase assembly protein I